MEAGTQTVDDGARSGAQPAAEENARQATTYVALLAREVDLEPEETWTGWEVLARVQGRTRAAAMEAFEERCPSIRENGARVQLVPERFWQEIVGKQEQPPPKMVWEGV